MISQVMHAQAVSGPVGVSLQAGSGGVPRGASGCLKGASGPVGQVGCLGSLAFL